ncbi:Mfb1p NDAI_0C04890 [Naumovozyma dairenensis CBS 421]|uniref:F-box domain-containing protein n=1 Tax=Naumovozyma dairenensis (strain ATCC 10597 / BCRC 20456 / CBS 421 / NBRC 0211 / NRRL Y-12639) TaxID=1071378 RepID=G0W8N7_NAUDC|nr:hypothetical protein NDAI_0C04890 [Naumovozyma dairenensis CBS 421]CCD24148.1 hypothetical protein NDAI_0C04890 [Naumovozyma dairenensis CBS 421]
MNIGNTKMDTTKQRSLTELPLNVIFKILLQLQMSDLQNLAKTCNLLRILANESVVYKNYYHNTNSSKNTNTNTSNNLAKLWTKKLIFDTFHILDDYKSNGSLSSLINCENENEISIIKTMHYIQKHFQLGENNEDTSHTKLLEDNNDNGIQEESNSNNNNNNSFAKDTLKYFKILNGIRNFINHEEISTKEQTKPDVNQKHPQNKSDYLHSVLLYDETEENSPTPIINTSSHSNHSRSSTTSTLFSDDEEWNITNEECDDTSTMKQNNKDNNGKNNNNSNVVNTPNDTLEKDSNEVVLKLQIDKTIEAEPIVTNKKYIEQNSKETNNNKTKEDPINHLRNSKKVKDKAALFENFLNMEQEMKQLKDTTEKQTNITPKSYGSLTHNTHLYRHNHVNHNNHRTVSIREISRTYLNEVQKEDEKKLLINKNKPRIRNTSFQRNFTKYKSLLEKENGNLASSSSSSHIPASSLSRSSSMTFKDNTKNIQPMSNIKESEEDNTDRTSQQSHDRNANGIFRSKLDATTDHNIISSGKKTYRKV